MEARKETGNGWTTDGRGAQWKAMRWSTVNLSTVSLSTVKPLQADPSPNFYMYDTGKVRKKAGSTQFLSLPQHSGHAKVRGIPGSLWSLFDFFGLSAFFVHYSLYFADAQKPSRLSMAPKSWF
ncbi:predicted protein [Sclerotinia sclerotiorum 1980 UF-70]|uniref:Uncharacterized protein n=1 Tax=Sclerotinia sclerotiorum (strain ATCC 18683 / 1980 / Ss-1) TaxID=665079 RepID=A7EIC6_SCLS1|nr:predicted protein [Sclerotinia sclerotiorum 1980 UF-70]EDO02592.1 predicted protein [Sclerotinia sclerotiorum 1980 UF-70]